MPNSNDELRDYLLTRQINLLRYSKSVQKKLIKLLEASEGEIRNSIIKYMDRLSGKDIVSNISISRLQELDKIVRDIRLQNFTDVYKGLRGELYDLSKDESQHLKQAVELSVPVVLDLLTPEAARLKVLVERNPFEGKILKDWIANISQGDVNRILAAVRIGLTNGQTTDEVVRNIFGSNSTNGIINITKSQLQTITRTAIMDIANTIRQEVYQLNSDVFDKEVYVATLDSRTSPICRANDGKIFEKGKGLMPPAHFNCRSLRVPLVTDKLIGERPIKPITSKQLLREFAKDQDLGKISDRDKLPYGMKKDFDKFSRSRVRELIGTVPSETTYSEFLKRQSLEFQEDVLGKTKAVLFRNGGLELEQFIDRNGNELNLSQLSRKYKDAFSKAGLNPSKYN